MNQNELSSKIIGAAIEVHRQLGPGLLEDVYEQCLVYELRSQGLMVEQQVPVPVAYKELQWDTAFCMDLLVEHTIVVEIKAVDRITHLHLTQLFTYLKLDNQKLGLLFNFNTVMMKDGIKRVVKGNFMNSAVR